MKNAILLSRKAYAVIWLLLVWLVNPQQLMAQAPTADFTTNVSSGCSPLVVQFTNQSTGNPTSFHWNLGNGSTSTVQNPTATYIDPGTYTITLTATNASGSSTKTATVTVTPGPVAKFVSTDTAGCTPLVVAFTDQSTTAAGSITQWEWNFGDGATSTQQNPTHTYTMSGTFNVFLKVTNSTGCSNTLFKQQYIRAGAGTQADFIANVPSNCQVPVTVSFTNNSQTTAGAGFLWEFGDGATSTQQNPTHTYNTIGNFIVRLTVQNADGCSSVKQDTIDLSGRNVSFTGPASVCTGSAAAFQMTSTPAPLSQTWDMGDGTSYATVNVNHTYNSPGTYTITLTNEFSGGCIATKTQTINVTAGPSIDFIADTTKACKPPFTVSFQPVGAASDFLWEFGDDSTSNQQNPTHTYQVAGNFNVRLTATSGAGCVTSIEKPAFIQIQPPSLAITNLPINDGCTPYTFTPVASINATEGVASYFWDFGNGFTSTDEEPSYTYEVPGNYTIKLRIETKGGCIDSIVYTEGVKIGVGVDLDFTAVPVNACVDQQVTFTLTTTASPITEYEWQFGDGESSDQVSPTHAYAAAGTYSPSVTIKYGNCRSRLGKEDYIEVLPPEARFSAERDCDNKRLIHFTNSSIGTGSYSWSFGDGGTSVQENPSHLYAADGTYIVSLTVDNGNCVHTFTDTIVVSSAPIDFFASKTIVCRGEAFTLKAVVPNTVSAASYTWTVSNSGASSVPADSIQWTLWGTGVFDVSLKIVTSNGCEETVNKTGYLTAYGPTADFSSDRIGGCLNTTVSFSDSSVSDGIHPITQWSWDFGDGTPPVAGTNVSHTYATTGNYQVALTVTDTYGCSDTRSKANFVRITNGKANFGAIDSMGCIGRNVVFVDSSAGNISNWLWNFGDGTSISGVQSPAHSYADSGFYTVTLKITEVSGCQDSISKTNFVTIKNPVARFGLSDTFSTCPPLSVSFFDSSYYVRKWSWDFDDGGSSPVASPINLYNIPDVYNVKLVVESPGGCTDSAFARITILGPYGDFNYGPLSGCTPLAVDYAVTSTEAVQFMWDYSDGIVDSSTSATASHVYQSGGKFVPKVILTDVSGCSVPVVGKDTIYIEKTNLDFTASQVSFCDSGTVVFTNQSIVDAPSATYEWFFGNATATTPNATHTYTAPGSYDVMIVATTTAGCRDTLLKESYIRVHQSPTVSIISQDSLCMPASFTFTAQIIPDTSTITTWNWTFGNGGTASSDSSVQVFNQDGNFNNTLFVEDAAGCSATAEKSVTVHPLPNLQVSDDITICRGETTQLEATGAVSYQWLQPNDQLSCTDCADPTAAPLQTTRYRVEGTSGVGCTVMDSVLVTVFQPFEVSVADASFTICQGRTVNLRAFGAPMYEWSPALGLSNTGIANPAASPDTSVTYQVVGYDALGCFRDSTTVQFTVLKNPVVNAGPDITISAGSTAVIQSTGSPDINAYNWTPSLGLSCTDCPNPTVTGGENTSYTVRVTNAAGCTAQDQVKVIVTCNEANIFIPNTFTPNADGMNDVFFIRGKGVFAVKSMRIFNRWGELIFERRDVTVNDPSQGWDGTYKGALASTDTYVYQVEVLCTNSQVMKYNGTISLIR